MEKEEIKRQTEINLSQFMEPTSEQQKAALDFAIAVAKGKKSRSIVHMFTSLGRAIEGSLGVNHVQGFREGIATISTTIERQAHQMQAQNSTPFPYNSLAHQILNSSSNPYSMNLMSFQGPAAAAGSHAGSHYPTPGASNPFLNVQGQYINSHSLQPFGSPARQYGSGPAY